MESVPTIVSSVKPSTEGPSVSMYETPTESPPRMVALAPTDQSKPLSSSDRPVSSGGARTPSV